MESQNITIKVSPSEEAMLVCPIPMSAVRHLLPVYQISWKQVQTFPIPINGEQLPDGVRLSSDNATLYVTIDNITVTRMYRCSLNMRRCNISATQIGDPCREITVTGPSMGFNEHGEIYLNCMID